MDQRCVRTCAVLCVVLGLISLAACGGGSSGSVTPPPKVTLSSIDVTPKNASIAAGSPQQFKATGTFSDGSKQDLTNSVTWISSNTTAATIKSAGLATGVAAGQSMISATRSSVTGSTNLTVTSAGPTLVSIAVTPGDVPLAVGTTLQFKATGTFSDNSQQDVTNSVTWSSSTSAATISSTTGLATGVAAGQPTITAKKGSVSGSTTLRVMTVASIAVKPANISIVQGTTQQFAATGTLSDNTTTQDLTGFATWGSDNTSAATVGNTAATKGAATGVAAGSANISAALGSVAGSTPLKVVAATIPNANWSLHRVDSQDQTTTPLRPDEAFRAFDGDPKTFWETNTTSPTPFPHEIEVDLGARYNITGFTYLPRQDGSTDGTISQYEFSVSDDAVTWTVVPPPGTGTFTPPDTTQKEVDFATPAEGRYVRLKALSEINGKNETSMAELGVLGTPVGASSQNNFSLQSVDSEATNPPCTNNTPATNSFDGNPLTFWHTEDSTCPSPSHPGLPHEIQLNLGNPQVVNGFRYLPRQDGSTDGMIGQYEFSVSNDASNWTVVTPGSPTFPATIQQKEVPFPDTTGQFVRLRALTEVNGGSSTSAAEINVLQCAVTPSVLITQPATYDLQTSSSLTVTAQACLDPSTEAGWGVRFTRDGGPHMDVTSQPFQATFTGVAQAEHTLEAQIIDNHGNVVSERGTHDQITHVGVGDYYVAMGDSITFGFNDNILSDDTAQDGRRSASDFGGWEPILDDKLTARKGHPQRVVNEGVGGTFAGTTCTGQSPSLLADAGVNLAPVLLMKHPNAQMFLVMYGTNDSSCPVSVADYKAAMQQIITLITNAGKKVAISHVPFVLASTQSGPPDPNPDALPQNLLIQQYNTAIDQLVAANGITVTPPDFYNLFRNNQNQYFDNWHPNGVLIQKMADAWNTALP